MAEKVWVVTRGEYSAYEIVAIFSTQETAEAFVHYNNVELFGGQPPCGQEMRIEGYDLDVPLQKDRKIMVRISPDGSVLTRYETSVTQEGVAGFQKARYTGEKHSYWGVGPTFEHARRAAEEFRRQHIVHGTP